MRSGGDDGDPDRHVGNYSFISHPPAQTAAPRSGCQASPADGSDCLLVALIERKRVESRCRDLFFGVRESEFFCEFRKTGHRTFNPEDAKNKEITIQKNKMSLHRPDK